MSPNLKAILLLAMLTVFGSAAFPVSAQKGAAEWSGEWQTFWRDGGALMSLSQEGERVYGTYEPGDGRIEGRVDGVMLRGRWLADGVSGSIVFALAEDGQSFTGRYHSGEYWNGQRLDASSRHVPRFTGSSSPRETLRSVVVAANDAADIGDAAALRFIEHFLLYEGASTGGPERNRRRTLLYQILNMSTFRIYQAPPRPQGDEAVFPIGPIHARVSYPLRFARDTAGRWQIVVEAEAVLDSVVERFLDTLGEVSFESLQASHARSPRGTMYAFITGANRWKEGGAEKALATLDLTFLPAEARGAEGPILVDYLKQIIDRAGFVIWQEIPNDPHHATPYVFYEHAVGNVVMERVEGGNEPGRWLFSAETLKDAPLLFSSIQRLPLAEGLQAAPPLTPFFEAREWIRARAPNLLHRKLLLENWQWLALFAALPIAVAAAWVMRRLVHALLMLAAGSEREAARARAKSFDWPVGLSVAGVLLNETLGQLGIAAMSFESVFRATTLLAAIGITWLCYRVVDAVGAGFMRRASATTSYADEIVTSLATGLTKLSVLVGGLIICADAVELPYEGVLTGLGVGGVALAFAARDTVSNMLGGVLLMTDRPFKRGDLVETEGQLAVIQQVGLRSTRLRRLDDAVVIIPNAQLSDKAIVNWGMRMRRRVDLSISVTYHTPRETLDAFVQRLKTVFASQPAADSEDCYIALKDFADSAIEIEFRGFFRVDSYEAHVKARHALVGDVIELAESLGVSFAFPTRTVHVLNAPPERKPVGEHAPRSSA